MLNLTTKNQEKKDKICKVLNLSSSGNKYASWILCRTPGQGKKFIASYNDVHYFLLYFHPYYAEVRFFKSMSSPCQQAHQGLF